MSKEYPLYTATYEGEIWDKNTRYEMVIITEWSDETANAKEVGHKAFYFKGSRTDAQKEVARLGTMEIYKHKEYTRF